MAEDDSIKIDAETFGKYADLKGIHIRQCPSCGTPDPGLLVHANESANLALTYSRGYDTLPTGLPLVAVECSNCGYLWLYNLDSVRAKIKGE